MLTAETQMALGKIRGEARIFPEVRTFFSNPPPGPLPPNSKFSGRGTHIDEISSPLSTAKKDLGENDVFTFYTVRLAIWAHQTKTYFILMWEKRVCCFENRLLGVKKKKVRKEKHSKESKRVKRNWGNLYCRCCCFNFTLFFNYSLFYFILLYFILFYFILFYFISVIFLPSTFSGTHVRTVRTGSYAPRNIA